MIEALLPGTVRWVEAFDDAIAAPLFPAEEATLVRAVRKRRDEYATARRCAREALAMLGVPPAPLLSGPRREPLWPAGIVGSITHCQGYRAAVVARGDDLAGVGIDAEPHLPLPEGVLGAIAVPAEFGHLARLRRDDPAVCWDRLLFSVKESVYKAWFPLAQRWLGFEEAEVEIDLGGGFTARLLVDGPPLADGSPLTGFSGSWMVSGGLLLSAVVVPAAGPANPPGRPVADRLTA